MQLHNDKWKPVAYCSRTLTNTEQKYAQIEKECLACVWACEKFGRFIFGLDKVKLQTDHKPLIPLINTRDLDQVPIRCQRLLMRLMRFSVVAEYAPGKSLVVADALSRSPLACKSPPDTVEDIELYVDSVTNNKPVSPERMKELKDATRDDPILKIAYVYTMSGWPNYQRDVPPDLRELFAVRGQLSISDGLLLFGDRIVIPSAFRSEMLSRIHKGHLGINKCLDRARATVWWPGITVDIKQIVNACEFCQIKHPTQQKEPLYTTPLPDGPWQRISADLCDYEGVDYLVLCDYYSRWIEVLHLPRSGGNRDIKAKAVITSIKNVFARFGIPYEVISDNGPQFSSELFAEFARSYGFSHIPVDPGMPQSNGAAERAVETAKSLLATPDPWMAIMIYRDTLVAATGFSPAQLMLGRHMRSNLPAHPTTLKPRTPDPDQVRANDQLAKARYEHYYNKRHGVRPLPELEAGRHVRMKYDDQKGWHRSGVVQGSGGTPRSYIVQSDSGYTLRRNRRHLQPYTPGPVDLAGDFHDPDPPTIPAVPAPHSRSPPLTSPETTSPVPPVVPNSPVSKGSPASVRRSSAQPNPSRPPDVPPIPTFPTPESDQCPVGKYMTRSGRVSCPPIRMIEQF